MADEGKIKNSVIKELVEKYKTIWSLNYLKVLAEWDLNTYMPEEGVEAKGEALAKLAIFIQNFFLDENFISLLRKAEKEPNLNDYEKAVIRLLQRNLKYYQKLLPEFIEEFEKVKSDAHIAWKNAREQNNFSLFAPFLEKIIGLSKRKAELLGYEKHPYDALLDEFEEGLTTDEVEDFFKQIKDPIKDLVSHIKKSPKYKEEQHEFEKYEFEKEKLNVLLNLILSKLHFNSKNLRIDPSPHPFSVYLGKGDNRITSYNKGNFANIFSSVIHEYGHALYDLQIHEELYYTPLENIISLVTHESQSRFWENFLGKSKGFLSFLYEDLKKIDAEFKKYSVEDIYSYLNLVKPGPIRVGADEVTYHLHIMIRFEIEKAMIEGKIKVADLPKMWNDKYEEYLGIRPKNDKEGILQDIHWSQGSIGYFPTYSIGTALSAVWKKHIEKDIGKIDDLAKTKEGIQKIQNWLKNNIHQYGATYLFRDLVQKATGEKFSAKPLLDYLEEKYKEIY